MLKRFFVICVLFSLTNVFAYESLYLSDFHYIQSKQEKQLLQNREISNQVYKAVDRLTSQNKSGLIPLKNQNFVAVYVTKQNVLRIASELNGLGHTHYILAKDEFGKNILILIYSQIEKTRAVARELIDYGFEAKAFINNQRLFYYDKYYAKCSNECGVDLKKATNSKKTTTTKKVVAKKSGKKNISQVTEDLGCDIVAKMRDKTFFNPKTNVFVINGIEYSELPKEFIDCNVTFVDAKLSKDVVVDFQTDENKTITGELDLPKEGILDDDFFFRPTDSVVKKEQKAEVKKVICDFSLPNGVRTALDASGQIIKLPQTYVGNQVELFYEVLNGAVKLSNSGYATILITTDNFQNHCRKVAQ